MNKNIVFMVLSVFSVQGAAYVAQLFMARVLHTDQFAVVRTVEAALQILSAVAPIGISLLVVRLAAQVENPSELRRRLTSYIVFAGVAGLAAGLVSSLGISLFSTRQADSYLHELVWVVVLSNLSRTALNFFYGKEKFALLSITTFVSSLCYLAILAAFVLRWQLDGWVAAKYLGELIFLIVSFFFIRPYLCAHILDAKFFCGLFTEGVAVSLSLVFRSALDNLPLLVLARLATSQTEVAMYGLCTLLTAGAMIIPGSINSVLLPKLGSMIKTEPASLSLQRKRFARLLVSASCFIAVAVVCAGLVLPWVLGEKYAGIVPMLSITVIVIPFKALTTLNGNLLFLNGKTVIGTQINGYGAFVSMILAVLSFKNFGVWGIVTIVVVVEVAMAIAFRSFATRKLSLSID